MAITVLGGGFDLSGVTANWELKKFDIEKWDSVIAYVKRIKADYETVKLAGHNFELQPYRIMGYFFFKSDALNLFINPDLKPSVKAQLSSRGVHALGHAHLIELVKNIGHEFGKPYFTDEPLKIYRQDFNLDVHVDKIDIGVQNVHARGKRGMIFDEQLGIQTLNVGSRGKETVYARFYDKLAEILERKTYWNYDVLRSYPLYNEMIPVLRIEFEIGGGWLKKFGLREYDAFKEKCGIIPPYLVNDHLQLVYPYDRDDANDHTNRNLIKIPLWNDIQSYVNANFTGGLKSHRVPDKGLNFVLHRQYLLRQEMLLKLSMMALYREYQQPYSYDAHSQDVLDTLNSLSEKTTTIEINKRARRYARLGICPPDDVEN